MDLRKDYFWNTIGTSANSFLSLLLLIVVTRINGIADSGIFNLCFMAAVLFYTIGMYGGRIYQVSDVAGEYESKNYVFLKGFTSLAMLVAVSVFVFVNGYTPDRVALIFSLAFYKITDALADPLYGIMQKNAHLYFAGVSMALKAGIGFGSFIIVDLVFGSVYYASFCLLAANVLFMIVWDIPKIRRFERLKNILSVNLAPTLSLLRKSAWIFAFSLMSMLFTYVPRHFADIFLTPEELGFFGIIIMPASMLSLFVVFIIQPKLVDLSHMFAEGRFAELDRKVTKMISLAVCFGVVAALAMWLVGVPVLSFIFGQDMALYRIPLTLAVVGGTVNTATLIWSNILSVMRRFTAQLFCYLPGVIALMLFCYFLTGPYGVLGGIFAFVFANAVLMLLYLAAYRIAIRKRSGPAGIRA
ncbi:MAG: oligosaccharide flippase family protein [Clostridiales Family XIII bacterium]|jgi:O-antigen/teichoic acid export membrane protein|nr:oligosaccharide flippase family protein [Clostridiales Family XIII bacterium]